LRPPDIAKHLVQALKPKFVVNYVGENTRLLPASGTTIIDARGNVERRLDGGVGPTTVEAWEIVVPAEPARVSAMDKIATAQDRAERKQRLSKRAVVGL
jgi:hypothetical protein